MKTILVDAANCFIVEGKIFEDMHKLLEEFPNKKIILTNANEEQKVKLGIVNMPYEVFSLSHNPDKTDPEYFKLMLKHFSLKAEDVVYFEHNLEAVKSAISVGIKSYLYKDLDGLREFLKKSLS